MNRKYLFVYALIASIVAFGCYVAVGFSQVKPFSPPNGVTRVAAIGNTKGCAPVMKAFLNAGDFEPIPIPKEGDWLDAHVEHGQTFSDYVGSNRMKLGDGGHSVIYLLPIGEFKGNAPDLKKLAEYLSVYLGAEVKVLARDDLAGDTITSRTNQFTKHKQILTTDIENALAKRRPKDSFALLGVTMTDLYPDPNWNFVFGQARMDLRVGVFSFARYDPAFPDNEKSAVTAETQKLVTLRSYKVMAHEVAHMFGIEHCIYFYCNMNGSNNQDEMDRQPLFMCPVELRKLQYAANFDPIKRYEKLKTILTNDGFSKEADWVSQRLSRLNAASTKSK